MKKLSLFLFLFLGIMNLNSFAANFTLESSAFQPNTLIPALYSCNEADISPPLTWQEIPPNTQSLAIVVKDPDAQDGEWIHWIIFNIPPSVTNLEENASLPEGAANGTNSWGTTDYKGPCPPIGAAHRYVFTLYALDTVLSLANGASKDQVLNAMTGHVIGSSELTGLYQKVPTRK
jgi:Raf kinase inhibitor-like YbhB/YbcL family protein